MTKAHPQKLARKLLLLGMLICLCVFMSPRSSNGTSAMLNVGLSEDPDCEATCDAAYNDCKSQDTILTDECLQTAERNRDDCLRNGETAYNACIADCNSNPSSPPDCGLICDDNAERTARACETNYRSATYQCYRAADRRAMVCERNHQDCVLRCPGP
jgi:hypothetical protein